MKMPRPTMANFVNVVGALVIVYLVVVLGETILRNYKLNQQANELKGQMIMLQDQKDELAYNIQFYKTDSFREREARAKLGLQLPGENVIILPRTPTPAPGSSPSETKTTIKKGNFAQWVDFLTGRG